MNNGPACSSAELGSTVVPPGRRLLDAGVPLPFRTGSSIPIKLKLRREEFARALSLYRGLNSDANFQTRKPIHRERKHHEQQHTVRRIP
jgi:hypothetical protein